MCSRLITFSERVAVRTVWPAAHFRNKRIRSFESDRLVHANTHLPKRRALVLAPESWKLLLTQLQAWSARPPRARGGVPTNNSIRRERLKLAVSAVNLPRHERYPIVVSFYAAFLFSNTSRYANRDSCATPSTCCAAAADKQACEGEHC